MSLGDDGWAVEPELELEGPLVLRNGDEIMLLVAPRYGGTSLDGALGDQLDAVASATLREVLDRAVVPVRSGKVAIMLRYLSPADPDEDEELAEPEALVLEVPAGAYEVCDYEASDAGVSIPVYEDEPDGEVLQYVRIVIRRVDDADLATYQERLAARRAEEQARIEAEAEAQRAQIPAIIASLSASPNVVRTLFVTTEGETSASEDGQTVRYVPPSDAPGLPALGALTQLQTLKILTPIEGELDDAVGDLPLRELDLSGWEGLQTLPASLGRLTELQTLRLPHSVRALPVPLAFPNLASLQLSLSAIWSAEGLDSLSSLNQLAVTTAYPERTELPRAIEDLPALAGVGVSSIPGDPPSAPPPRNDAETSRPLGDAKPAKPRNDALEASLSIDVGWDAVHAVVCLPERSLIVAGERGGFRVAAWDVTSGERAWETRLLPGEGPDAYTHVELGPEGTLLVSTSTDEGRFFTLSADGEIVADVSVAGEDFHGFHSFVLCGQKILANGFGDLSRGLTTVLSDPDLAVEQTLSGHVGRTSPRWPQVSIERRGAVHPLSHRPLPPSLAVCNVPSFAFAYVFEAPGSSPVAFAPNCEYIVVQQPDGRLRSTGVMTAQIDAERDIVWSDDPPAQVAGWPVFDADTTRIAVVVDDEGGVDVYDWSTRERLATLPHHARPPGDLDPRAGAGSLRNRRLGAVVPMAWCGDALVVGAPARSATTGGLSVYGFA